MTLEIREYRPGDETALLAAFATVCSAGGVGPPTLEEWRWTCERNPAGRRVFLALDGGRVVGHYAAVPRRTWIGRETLFAERVGAFATRSGPRGLQREHLYARLGRAMAETYGAPGGDLVHYGFPGAGEWRLENGLLDSEVVRNQTLLVRAAGNGASERPPEIERIERFDHQAQWLWERIAGTFGAGAIRDAAFLNWRFVERPAVRYELLGVRDASGILRGFVALRAGEFAGRRAAWLVDWLVPSAEDEVGARLLAAALAWARAQGEKELATLLPEWSPWYQEFQRAGFRVHPSEGFLACRSFSRKFDEVWLREHWWFTLADVGGL